MDLKLVFLFQGNLHGDNMARITYTNMLRYLKMLLFNSLLMQLLQISKK